MAEFESIAVAECPEFGNALYYYAGPDDWRTVFRGTKSEALRQGARRILHVSDWKLRLRRLVTQYH